jgi:hypothetical protein
MDWSELRKAVEEIELVDGHAHNLVALDSNFPFIHAFSEAQGHALSSSQHSLSFKVYFPFQPLLDLAPFASSMQYSTAQELFLFIVLSMNMKKHIYISNLLICTNVVPDTSN